MARGKKVPKNKVYKRGGSLKKASYGTGKLRKAGLGQDILGGLGSGIDAFGNFIGDTAIGVGRGAWDLGAGVYDYLGDAETWGGSATDADYFGWDEKAGASRQDMLNQRRPDFLHSDVNMKSIGDKIWNRNPNKTSSTSTTGATTPAADTDWRGVPQTQMTDAQFDQMMIDKRAGNYRRGGAKKLKYGGEGHIVPGKVLRRGPKR